MTAVGVGPAQGAHLGREPFPEPLDGRLALGLISSLPLG